MKLPAFGYDNKEYNAQLFDACQKAAIQLTVRTGIIVQAVMQPICPAAGWQYQPYDPNAPEPDWEIIFKAMGQKYDNLKEARRALQMKAFS